MVRLTILFLAMAIGLTGCLETTGNSGAVHQITAREADSIRLNQMDLLNTIRAERGLAPVTLSAPLTAAANTHGRDMAVQLRAWNFGSDHSSPQTRARRAGFTGLITGENVAETFMDSVQIFQVWLNDPRAKAAMLHPDATHIGLGWYQEENGKLWWVQLMGAANASIVTAELQ